MYYNVCVRRGYRHLKGRESRGTPPPHAPKTRQETIRPTTGPACVSPLQVAVLEIQRALDTNVSTNRCPKREGTGERTVPDRKRRPGGVARRRATRCAQSPLVLVKFRVRPPGQPPGDSK